MTHTTHTTHTAAARCADLANADFDGEMFFPEQFSSPEDCWPDRKAFRREVERIDARDREVLACLTNLAAIDTHDDVLLQKAKDLLRANLLPTDPQPQTLLEEFIRRGPNFGPGELAGARKFADWIAKRQEKEA